MANLIPDGDEVSTGKILETTASGKKLLIKSAGGNSTDLIPLELTLTSTDQAEAIRIWLRSSSTEPAWVIVVFSLACKWGSVAADEVAVSISASSAFQIRAEAEAI
jgi:hypothetical protein